MVFLGSHLLSIYYSFTREIFLLLVLKTAFKNFKRYILQEPITSWFLLKRQKLRVYKVIFHPRSSQQPPPPPPPHHSFNYEWNLGPRRNQDGGWRMPVEAWTFKCLHRLSRTSLPRLKRLTIFWLICRRLAYFYVWKCATYATGKQHNVCWPRCKIEGRLSSSPEFDETL